MSAVQCVSGKLCIRAEYFTLLLEGFKPNGFCSASVSLTLVERLSVACAAHMSEHKLS